MARRPRPTVAPSTGLDDTKRTLAAHLAGALATAVFVLAGTALLGGTLGPWLVLAVAALAAFALHRRAQARLHGLELSDDDRMLQTAATGLLVLAVGFAALAAVLLTVL